MKYITRAGGWFLREKKEPSIRGTLSQAQADAAPNIDGKPTLGSRVRKALHTLRTTQIGGPDAGVVPENPGGMFGNADPLTKAKLRGASRASIGGPLATDGKTTSSRRDSVLTNANKVARSLRKVGKGALGSGGTPSTPTIYRSGSSQDR